MTQSPISLTNEAYVNQIIDNLHNQNKEKLRTLLEYFPERDAKTQVRVLFDISVSDTDIAFFALTYLAETIPSNVSYKHNVIELLLDKSRTISQFILPFIEQANPDELKEAVPVFASILLNETDSYILQKVLHAIGETKDKSCINVVADFIFYDHEELKRAATVALGKIGGASAIKRLSFASQTSKCDDFILETLEKLTSQLSLDGQEDAQGAKQFASRKDTLEGLAEDSDMTQLIFMLNSASPNDRHLAIDSLIEIGPQVIPAVSENIDLSSPDSIINGLDILGNLRNAATLPSILKILNIRHPDSNVRFAAYEAISRLSRIQSSVSLIDGITDESEQVRLAAATAINNNCSDVIIAGLKSKIETSGRQSKRALIITAVIDSLSSHIFSSLMDSDAFVFNAMEYLSKCDTSTVSYFKNILTQRGSLSLANSIETQVKNPGKNKKSLTIYCVDDSSICLKYYVKFFHSLGHHTVIFEDPKDALNALETEKPDLITSDLNMLSMNGLQLAENVREIYSVEELPIVIITTQNDFVSSFLAHNTQPSMSHINFAILKPLSSKLFKPVLNQII